MNAGKAVPAGERSPLASGVRTWIWLAIGTLFLVLCLAPTLRIPIYGDDLHWPILWYHAFGGDLWTAVSTAWSSDLQPNRFNPVGREFALVYHFLAYDLSSALRVDMQWFYRIGAFALIWLAVLAAAFAFRQAVRFVSGGNRVSVWQAFALLAGIFAITMQLHPWSHDPTVTITEIGYGVAILSFLLIGLAFSAARPEVGTLKAALPVGVLSLLGVMFYETFVSAIIGAAIIYVLLLWKARRVKSGLTKPLVLLAVGVLLPALVFIVGRLYVSTIPNIPDYAGTEIALRPEGLRVFGVLLAGSLPAATWRRSTTQIGGIGLMNEALVTSVLIILLCLVVVVILRRQRPLRLILNRRLWIVIAVYGAHLLVTFVMQSFTEKYINEIRELGTIYISYGTAALVVAAALLVLVGWLPRRAPTVGIFLLPLLAVFIVVQQATNWTLATYYSESYAENRAISETIVTDTSSNDDRCELLGSWDQVWDYGTEIRQQLSRAMEENFEQVFDKRFCVPDSER